MPSERSLGIVEKIRENMKKVRKELDSAKAGEKEHPKKMSDAEYVNYRINKYLENNPPPDFSFLKNRRQRVSGTSRTLLAFVLFGLVLNAAFWIYLFWSLSEIYPGL